MDTFPLRNIIRTRKLTIILLVGITLLLYISLSRIAAQYRFKIAINTAGIPDRLAYVSDNHQLMLHDPQDRTEMKLLDNVSEFVIGQDGRVAYTQPNDSNLYLFDPSTPALDPVNVSPNVGMNSYPLAWSPDGRYLAFGSYQDSENLTLYVWDGENVTNIMPDGGLDKSDEFYVDWSQDGRLVFTIHHGWQETATPPEIYVWDGITTKNLSQNPQGWDSRAHWSRSGKLMFGSQRGEEYGVYVWDGVSFKNSVPDSTSFIQVAPQIELHYPIWTDDDRVGFTTDAEFSPLGRKEIILWDMGNGKIFKQIPVSSGNAWSWLAEGGQAILSSHLASGIPSVYLDVESTEGEILFSNHVGEFAWSESGYLAYCGIEGGKSQILSIWNGQETWVVARVRYKPVQWQNGRDNFSCNNG
jgi:WD40 repeat protein